MKEIELKSKLTENKRVLKTPFLTREEAAAYCAISLRLFDARAKAALLPFAGDEHNKRYDVHLLRRWMNGELPNCPFKSTSEGDADNE